MMRAASISGDSVGDVVSFESSDLREVELVGRAKKDPQAFGQLYEIYYTRIINYIYRSTLDVGLAEDLTANTFFKALRGLPKYRGGAPFGPWLYRIATNEIKMHWRSAKARHEKDLRWRDELRRIHFNSRQTETDEDIEEKMQRFVQLRDSLAALPERYRTVLVLRYFEQLSYDEIAETLGKRLGTIKSLIHRGLSRLKHQIQDEDATNR
jgi:RNA polymerase sigma-70 factor (ECF subfamily)